MARRVFWKAKKRAKAVGTIDQFDADCAQRWAAARYESEPVVEAVVRGPRGAKSGLTRRSRTSLIGHLMTNSAIRALIEENSWEWANTEMYLPTSLASRIASGMHLRTLTPHPVYWLSTSRQVCSTRWRRAMGMEPDGSFGQLIILMSPLLLFPSRVYKRH